MRAALATLAAEVLEGLTKRRLVAATWTLKVKYHDFRQVTRAHTGPRPIGELTELMTLLGALLDRTEAASVPVRLLGVTASGLAPATEEEVGQLGLF